MQAEYFRAARNAIESRSGHVEKFIGDAVVGAFGVHHARDVVNVGRAQGLLLGAPPGVSKTRLVG